MWPLILADESSAVGVNPVLCHTCSLCKCTILLENEASWQKSLAVCNQFLLLVAKYQRKVWRSPWPSLVLYRCSRLMPDETMTCDAIGSLNQKAILIHLTLLPNMVVPVVYRWVEIKVLLVGEKHLLCSFGRDRRSFQQRSRRSCLIVSEMTCAGTRRNAVRRISCFAICWTVE